MLVLLLLIPIGGLQVIDASCTYPSDIQNNIWTSSDYGDMDFGTSMVTFKEDASSAESNWTCVTSSGTKYVIQYLSSNMKLNQYLLWPPPPLRINTSILDSMDLTSQNTVFSNSLNIEIYTYYCFDFIQQGTDSYLYYHPTVSQGIAYPADKGLSNWVLVSESLAVDTNNGKRRKQLVPATVAVSDICSESIDAAEYNVIVKTTSASSVQNLCVNPLLGNFLYYCTSGSTSNGTINACDASGQTSLAINNTACSTTASVLHSAGGVLNCVAKTSTTISTDTTYYQTLYNTDSTVNNIQTYRFVCLAVTTASNGTVYLSYSHTSCISGQTATVETGTALVFEPLIGTALCPTTTTSPTTTITITEATSNNTALIVGLVVGILLLIIGGILIFYFCFYKRDPNAGKPIVENTKPRFEDPDMDDILEDLEVVDSRSTPATRDEIIFEAMSPSMISNGRLPNGNPISLSPTELHHTTSFYPNGMANGSIRRDSGIGTEKSGRPTPRIGLNPTRESMVIFNGDEKVISGNDTRIVPNLNPNARMLHMENTMTFGGPPLTLTGLDNEEEDVLGELTPHGRENMPYPSMPREKSNLLPPIETTDPERDTTVLV